MAKVEKISIALPAEMLALVHRAVEKGEYASSSEVVRDALRDWTEKRRRREQAVGEVRKLWQEAVSDPTPAEPMEEVMERLINKYENLANDETQLPSA